MPLVPSLRSLQQPTAHISAHTPPVFTSVLSALPLSRPCRASRRNSVSEGIRFYLVEHSRTRPRPQGQAVGASWPNRWAKSRLRCRVTVCVASETWGPVWLVNLLEQGHLLAPLSSPINARSDFEYGSSSLTTACWLPLLSYQPSLCCVNSLVQSPAGILCSYLCVCRVHPLNECLVRSHRSTSHVPGMVIVTLTQSKLGWEFSPLEKRVFWIAAGRDGFTEFVEIITGSSTLYKLPGPTWF